MEITSGRLSKCLWLTLLILSTLPGGMLRGQAITAVSVTPSSGSGASQTFTLLYSDSAGATDLTVAYLWIEQTLTIGNGTSTCLLLYYPATNQLTMYNDAGTGWLASVTLGSPSTLSNSQCSVGVPPATASRSGNNLTVALPLTFAATYAGAKNIYMYAGDSSVNSGWQTMGSWTATGAPTITGLAPAWGLTGQQVTITGSGFGSSQGTSTVTFNGVSAGMAASWSATSITVSVPSGATTGSVVVTTGGGASNGMTFTVAPSNGGVEPWVYGSGGAIYFTGGNVGIGTLNPQSALSVNGTVQAKQVVVNTGWSDYVFAPGYYLAPLTDVAAYIKANRHLPGMPSSAEVEKNGVSVGEVEAELLEKIEELTLHMIEAEKQSALLDEQNRSLREQLEKQTREFEARIARLEGGK